MNGFNIRIIPKLGIWLIVSHCVGIYLFYRVLTKKGEVISRTMVQHLPEIYKKKVEIKENMDSFDEHISVILLIYNVLLNKLEMDSSSMMKRNMD